MMSGERELQPGGAEKCARLEPARGSHSTFRYINAGNWVARRGVADRLLADWQRTMESAELTKKDDQTALQELVWARDTLSYKIKARQ